MISGTSENGRDKNRRGNNEWGTAEGQPVYTFPWHWLLEETIQMFPWTNTGKADGTDLRAETLPYITTCNCTDSHEMHTTNKHFTRPLPFLMIISVLREYWVFTAKIVQSLFEWTWPSPLLDVFIPVLFSSALCFYRFQLFFLRPLCSQEIIRKNYKDAIIILDEWDLFWYFGPNDPSLPSFQGMNCLLMFVKCHWQRTLSVALQNRMSKWFNISKLSGSHTVADFLEWIFDKVIQSYVLKLY